MSTGTTTPPEIPLATPIIVSPPTACEGFIDQRLRQTRRRVKTIDVATGLVVLAIGVLTYLLAAALIDQWMVTGGLAVWGRFVLWFGLVATAGTYFVTRLLPPLLHRINPIYAAATIEKSQPTLKNSLINFLLLRGRRQEVAAPFYRAMESRAAADLSHIEVDVAVDRTHLVRLACVLLAIVALFSLYLVVSPKNPLRSAARVLLPWSTIEAPTRVTIRDVHPCTETFFHGDSVTVWANVTGLRTDEPLLLIYSTSDDQIADQEIPMTRTGDSDRYECHFPPGSLGFQQDCEYYLAGGDCRSPHYRITVQTAPAVVIDSIDYRYPSYTSIAHRTVQQQDDLRAIEGTEVTLHVTANTEIKPGTAEIDLGCSGLSGVQMSDNGKSATGHFTLRLMEGDPSRPSHDCYQIRFRDLQGRENQKPIRHNIDVLRDQPPEVELVEPQQAETQVAENGKLAIKVRAADPDFALRRVSLRAERDGRSLPIAPLLEKRNTEKPWTGEFVGTCSFEPAKLGLKAGDRVQYFAEAEDNKEPVRNRSATDKRWIIVVSAESKPAPDEKRDAAKNDQPQPDDQNSGKDGAGKSAENKGEPDAGQLPDKNDGQGNEKPDAANAGADQPPKGDQPPDKPAERINDKTDPGAAIQEMLKDRKEEQEKQKQESNAEKGNAEKGNAEKGNAEKGNAEKGNAEKGNAEKGNAEKGNAEKGNAEKGNAEKGNAEKGNAEKGNAEKGNAEKGNAEKGNAENGNAEKGNAEKGNAEKGNAEKGNAEKGNAEKGNAEKGNAEKGNAEKGNAEKGNAEKGNAEKGNAEKGNAEKGNAEKGNAEKGNAEKGNAEKGNAEKGYAEKGNAEKGNAEKGNAEKGNAEKGNAEKGNAEKGNAEKGNAEKGNAEKGNAEKGNAEKGNAEKGNAEKGNAEKGNAEKGNTEDGNTGKGNSGMPNDQKETPGAGENAGKGATPAPQEANKDRNKQPGAPSENTEQQEHQDAKSPSISPHQSDSQGSTSGDRSGGGQAGGGQRADKKGTGSSGSNTAANEGGSHANEPGTGDVGTRPGNKAAASKDSAGSQKPGIGGKGGERSDAKPDPKQAPSGQTPGTGKSGTPQENPAKGGAAGNVTSEGSGTPNAIGPPGGGAPGQTSGSNAAEPIDTPADEANLKYLQQQTDLALEHLRDQLAKEKPKLLERLGWSKDEAKQFLDRWEAMKRAAAESGPEGEAARKKFADAIQSLGLSQRGTELGRGGVTPDQPQELRDRGRFAVPPEWDDQLRAYTRGISNGNRQEKQGQK